jgi:predicted nucleotidyltransferase component of viral defense system
MLTRHAITKRADEDGVDAAVVERDYVLAHIVAQLSHATPSDGGRLVFKGGTALRFVHIQGYRYSADLDFTIIGGTEEAAIPAIGAVLGMARAHAGLPHLQLSEGNSSGIEYIGPLGSDRPRKLKLDLATDEHVADIARMPMGDIWPDLPAAIPFDVYPIEEISAEKLRCVIQRVQCRDLYDLYRLSEEVGIDLAAVRPLFEDKCRVKKLDPAAFPERLADRLDRYRQRWDAEMSEHIADFPRLDDVERIMRRHLRRSGFLGD